MERKYFVVINSEQKGPFSLDELRDLKLKRTDLVWYDGMADWKTAYEIEELKSLFEINLAKNVVEKPVQEIVIEEKKDQTEQNHRNLPVYVGNEPRVLQRIGFVEYLDNNTVRETTSTEVIYYRFANFGERLLARIIDTLIICIPGIIAPIIAPWLYFSLQYSGDKQQTVGQNSMRIKVLSTDGTKVTFGQGTGRYFAMLLNAFTLFIGYIMFFFNPKNQCLHDVLANTIIVSEIKREMK